MPFKVGDKVRKNPTCWISTQFDSWGSGEGVGEVVAVNDGFIDVRWLGGRSMHYPEELLPAEPDRKSS